MAQRLIEHAWGTSLQSGDNTKPWPWADTWPIAELLLPQQDHKLYVLNGIHGSALAFGPGHMQGTPLPGEEGVSVIAAHRDTHFSSLRNIALGDSIVLSTLNGVYRFEVETINIVDSSKASLHIDEPGKKLKLITCYPFDSLQVGGDLRYVVSASRIDS